METDGTSFRVFIQNELIRRTQANPRYSLRAFARSLKMDHSTLVKVLHGKRQLGKRATLSIAAKLGLNPSEAQALLPTPKNQKDQVEDHYQQLTLDSFAVISDWYHFAILELLRIDHFQPQPGWIAEVLGIEEHEAEQAIVRLKRLGLIEVDSEGRWFQPNDAKTTTTGNPFTARAFRNLQRQILQKAIVALEEVPMESRDQTSMTMAIDVQKLPEAKKKITEFRRELAAYLSRGERRDEVYHLSISLYPVSQIQEEEL